MSKRFNFVSGIECAAIALMILAVPVVAAEGQAHGEDPDVFLSSDIGNSLITLIIFGLVVFFLGKFAWPAVLNVLQQREDMIHNALVEAKREREAADELLARYQEQIDRAREDATELVEEGKRDAEAVRERIHAQAKQEADQMIDRARREIQIATDDAVKKLYDMTTDVAVRVAGSVISKELSPADHADLVRESLERMRASDEARFN